MVDYSPTSLDSVPDTAMTDIEELLSILNQCPNYQVDKHHTNCGLRVRIEPILAYFRSMLSPGVVAIPYADWKRRGADISWVRLKVNGDKRDSASDNKFLFTRAIANDQRLRYEGAMYVDRMARAMFTADAWDWTPET